MSTDMQSAEASVNRFLAGYLESQVDLWRDYVDPREAYLDSNGEVWSGIGRGHGVIDDAPFQTVTELFEIQTLARIIARENEFALNGHINRINYIVGWGHVYKVQGRGDGVPDSIIGRVQSVLDEILKANRWCGRQREIMFRNDRDGESFIRKFRCDDGLTRFRFVEPRSVQPPPNAKDYQSFGVETLPSDCETPVAYWVDGKPVGAGDMQHRKYNVDSSIKRGLPLFHPVRKNLIRASKLLRNMSLATEIQTAIALIRKHQQANKEAVRSFIAAKAESQGGRTDNVLRYGPGSILDAPEGQDYSIPPQLDPSKTVSALQAELRAVAARLVMPEFMLTSDASNANFSSTMVAEGPAVKNFEAEQQAMIELDIELLDAALDHAADCGLMNHSERAVIKIQATAPSVHVRDKLAEAQVRQIDMGLMLLSPQTATSQIGENYEQEQINIELHNEKMGGMPTGLSTLEQP